MTQSLQPLDIPLARLGYIFATPPLLIGGMAMQQYGLRQAGADVDFVVTRADYTALAALHPGHLKDLHGDLGVIFEQFEVWTTICLFDYDALVPGAIACGAWRLISLEKLLLLKCLGMDQPKYAADVRLIVQRLLDIQYDKA